MFVLGGLSSFSHHPLWVTGDKASEPIQCATGWKSHDVKVIIPESWINDGYCDCPFDGLDEPDTDACSGSKDWPGVAPHASSSSDTDADDDNEYVVIVSAKYLVTLLLLLLRLCIFDNLIHPLDIHFLFYNPPSLSQCFFHYISMSRTT